MIQTARLYSCVSLPCPVCDRRDLTNRAQDWHWVMCGHLVSHGWRILNIEDDSILMAAPSAAQGVDVTLGNKWVAQPTAESSRTSAPVSSAKALQRANIKGRLSLKSD
jgi:hypothetical protein